LLLSLLRDDLLSDGVNPVLPEVRPKLVGLGGYVELLLRGEESLERISYGGVKGCLGALAVFFSVCGGDRRGEPVAGRLASAFEGGEVADGAVHATST
jgi:hypothetical protein